VTFTRTRRVRATAKAWAHGGAAVLVMMMSLRAEVAAQELPPQGAGSPATTPTPTPAPPNGAPQSQAVNPEALALFNEAMALMEQGRYAEACPKLEACRKLGGGLGALFNLSDCYEHTGRTASAWKGFHDVAAAAEAAGQTERASVARARAAVLEPTLPKLRIVVKQPATSGLSVSLDGVPVAPSAWGIPLLVDPGAHRIAAAAEGKNPWSRTVDVAAKPDVETVDVPELAPLPARNETKGTGTPPPSRGWSGQRIAATSLGGLGIAGVVVGAIFAVRAKDKRDESYLNCLPEDPNRCSTQGVELRDESFTAAHISTAGFVVGAAAIVTGGILFFTDKGPSARRATKQATSLHVTAGPSGSTLTLVGRF
jgi:hypothetical protein